jgi:hypothetical protein
VAPKDPLIAGGPSQIVVFDRDQTGPLKPNLYVARKYLYTYDIYSRTVWGFQANDHDFSKVLDLSDPAGADTTELNTEAMSAASVTDMADLPDGFIMKNTHDGTEYTWLKSRGLWSTARRWARLNPDPLKPYIGNLVDVAATEDYLYVLTMEGWNAYSIRLWKSSDGREWTEVPNNSSYAYLENIYGRGATLYAGAFNGTSSRTYGILYDNGSGLAATDAGGGSPVSGRLVGAQTMGGVDYVASPDGVFYGTTPSSLTAASFGANVVSGLCGIINVDGVIAAVSGGGSLYYGDSGGFSLLGGGSGFTGALTVFRDASDTPKLLLLGYRGSGYYSYGYRELVLETASPYISGSTPFILHEAGDLNPGSSVANTNAFRSSLGRRVVRSIIQTPGEIDSNRILFASTQTKGLWSYRGDEWNAEE